MTCSAETGVECAGQSRAGACVLMRMALGCFLQSLAIDDYWRICGSNTGQVLASSERQTQTRAESMDELAISISNLGPRLAGPCDMTRAIDSDSL